MPNEEILKYIKDCLSQNYSKEQIKQSLIQAGWGNSQIEEALLSVQNTVATVSTPPLPKETSPVINSYAPEKDKVSIAKEFAEAKPAVSSRSILPLAIIAGTAVIIVGIGITFWILTKNTGTSAQLATEQTIPIKATTKNINESVESDTITHTPLQTPSTKAGEYSVPIDSTIKEVSFSVVFKPENRDRTYDSLEKTGGQNFYLQSSELSKFSTIEPATRGESLLVLTNKLNSNSQRKVTVVTPSGKTVVADPNIKIITWSAGEVITIKNPEPGNWKLNITGNGEFSTHVTANSKIAIIDFDFVKLGGRLGHQGYFPIDKTPAIGAQEILQIDLSEDSVTTEMPSFQIIDENGKVIDSLKFYATTRGESGEFAGVVKIPSQDFRILVSGVDSQSLRYQRIEGAMISPEQKAAPLTQQEIAEFIKANE